MAKLFTLQSGKTRGRTLKKKKKTILTTGWEIKHPDMNAILQQEINSLLRGEERFVEFVSFDERWIKAQGVSSPFTKLWGRTAPLTYAL